MNPRLLHTGFESQAAARPDAVAVICGAAKRTYAQLNAAACAVAQQLRAAGCAPGDFVAVDTRREVATVVGLLGVLKCGAAYLPLDPHNPTARRQQMLADAQARFILSSAPAEIRAVGISTPCLELSGAMVSAATASFPCPASDHDLAYVIFTSGSTGIPKGVLIEHHAVVNTIDDINQRFGVGPSDRTFMLSAFGFDLSVYDLFGIWAAGGTVVIPTAGESRVPTLWEDLLERHQITIWNSVPALMEMLVTLWESRSQPIKTALRLAMLSGDWIPVTLPTRMLSRAPAMRIESLGGATEGSIWSIGYSVKEVDPAWTSIPYGKALRHQAMYVLDEQGQPTPVGVPGEIHIGGVGVARGYLNRPELTAKRFIPDHLTGTGTLYRTGDQGKLRPDGNIEFLGRLDSQVKIHGYRIELGEIEAALQRHPAVRECAVVAPADARQRRRLVAYVARQPETWIGEEEFLQALAEGLPEYMLPKAIHFLEKFPLTANGKVDRAALLQTTAQVEPLRGDDLPKNELERQVGMVWAKVLQRETVPMQETFLSLGGDSLQMVELMIRLGALFDVELPMTTPLNSGKTPREMARLLDSQADLRPRQRMTPAKRNTQNRYPASPQQQQMWTIEHSEPRSAAYHIPLINRIHGPLDVAALQQAIQRLIERHEALRTTLHSDHQGQLWQQIETSWGSPWSMIHLTRRTEAEQDEVWSQALHALVQQPFDLSSELPIRVLLGRLAADDHLLAVVVHHVAFDGWSLGVWNQELSGLYEATLHGQEVSDDGLMQYLDFSVYHATLRHEARLQAERAYWKEQLAGELPVLELPLDFERPVRPTYRGSVLRLEISRELTDDLKEVARQHDCTLFAVLVSIWSVLLARYSQQTELVIGTPLAGRHLAESQRLIGYLINVVALRIDLGGDPEFRKLLAQTHHTLLAAMEHQDLPWTEVVRHLGFDRTRGDSAPFRAMIVLHNTPIPPLQLADTVVAPLNYSTETAKFDLILSLTETAAGLKGELEFATDLFRRERAEQMVEHLRSLLAGSVQSPELPVSHLPLLSAAELAQLESWGTAISDYPREQTLEEVFQVQVAATPLATAVVFGAESWSYRRLDEEATRIALVLMKAGVSSGTPVGLCLRRSPRLIAAILGILKAGGAYVPLDENDPQDRLEFATFTAGVTIAVVENATREPFVALGLQAINLDRESLPLGEWHAVRHAFPNSPAYILFTSGTTGRPKAVTVPQQAVVRLVKNTNYLPFSAELRFLQLAPLSFDASTLEIWGPLLSGGTLALAPRSWLSLDELQTLLNEHRVNTLWLTAGLFQQVAEHRAEMFAGLRYLLAGGDVLPAKQVAKLLRQYPDLTLINGYGPTENTTFTTSHVMRGSESIPPGEVPIGRPIANTSVVLLDAQRQLVPPGVPGEIHCGGDGLALGYAGDPQLTAQKFILWTDPDQQEHRLYRTGDLGRWNAQGVLEFLGRKDHQIKIRGFRIEPAEIERAICHDTRISQAVVVTMPDASGYKQLVAYLAVRGGIPLPVEELSAVLRRQLPAYMVPNHWVFLEELPLDNNGKVNRAALPLPSRKSPGREVRLPRTTTEKQLAQIWRKTLEVDAIDVRDNFFDLGGDSLIAVAMLAQVSHQFNCQLTATDLVRQPTIAELAALISGERPVEGSGGAVEIRGGSEPALFFAPCINANLLTIRALAERLPSRQAIYGLLPQGLDGVSEIPESIEGIAEQYLREVRMIQPTGPYFLAGYSLGGAVAFEMAKQLSQDGEEVAFLGLFDAPWTARPWPVRAMLSAWRWVRTRVGRDPLENETNDAGIEPELRARMVAAQMRALCRYRPEPYSGPATLFRVTDRGGWVKRKIDHGVQNWAERGLVHGDSPLIWVPGTHDTMFAEPHLARFSEAVQTELAKAFQNLGRGEPADVTT